LAGVTPDRVREAAVRALTPKPRPRVDLFHVAPVRISVADALVELVEELPRVGRISFARLTADLAERLEVIVRFLAVLELFKQGQIDLDQADRCGEITITWCGDPDPDVAAMAVDVYEG
jgi:segregation and condensation protein A